jgi:hypothetical protein
MLDANIATINLELHSLAKKYQDIIDNRARVDAAVVVQPFLEGVGPDLEISFLNVLDCFHPSTEGHELLATGLWNSMLCVDDR